jgi:hypothetical protein
MKSDTVKSYVILLLVLQVISVALLWVLNVLSDETSSVFAVLLAANLIAFAMVVQVYRNPSTVEPGTSDDTKPAPAPESTTHSSGQ